MLNQLRQLFPQNTRQYREETSQRIAWGHWFAFFNIVIALIIASRYALNADWPNTLSGKLYFFISLFGHFSFVVFAFYLLILFPLSFVINNTRSFRIFAVIFATVGQTTLLVDTEVFKQFYLHLSSFVWQLLLTPDNGSFTKFLWQLPFLVPLILILETWFSRWSWQKQRSFSRQKWGKYVALFFLACFCATHLIYAWADMSLNRPIASQKANYPLSYPMTARTFLQKHGLVNKEEIEQQIETTGRLDTFYLNYPQAPLTFSKKATNNVVLLNISGLSNAMITPEKMPMLAQIAGKSHRFVNHYASGETAMASTLGIFYGLSGKYIDAVLSERKASPLIDAFKQANYQFGLFSYNGFSDPLYQRALFPKLKLSKTKGNIKAIAAWQSWLAHPRTAPFFNYLELEVPTTNSQEESLKLLDWQITQIWQQLETQALLSNTLVIITSDLAQPNQETGFDIAKMQVPLLFYWQGDSQVYTQLSSHLDIMPTILSPFFGVNNAASDYSQGVDLTQKKQRLWVLASNYKWNVAILANKERYQVDQRGNIEYFNAQGKKETKERQPLAIFLQMIKQSNQFMQK